MIHQEKYQWDDIIKFSYKKSVPRSTSIQLILQESDEQKDIIIKYKNKYTGYTRLYGIIGVIHGTQTSTFRNVTDCKPSLCLSFILKSRTYDFQFTDKQDYIIFMSYMHTFLFPNTINIDIILNFQQNCNNYSKKSSETYVEYFNRIVYQNKYIKYNEKNDCPICLEQTFENIKLSTCEHIFCKSCFTKWSKNCLQIRSYVTCPICREKIK